MEKVNLKGKKVIVTGAYQGIGNEIVKKLLKNGASVLVVDKNPNVTKLVKEMKGMEGNIHGFCTDIVIEENVVELIEYGISKLSGFDILVNNAGIMQTKPFLEISGDDWDRMLSVNLKSVFLLSKYVVKQMIKQRSGGVIINISSIAGRSGRPLSPHYAASKAGVISLSKSMAEAFGKNNIRTNAVCPGVIYTPMMEQIYQDRKAINNNSKMEEDFLAEIKLNRLGTPEDIANTVLFLSSPHSEYINGQAINVCGGYEMN